MEQAEQAKAFPGHGVSCQETQRLCLYCAQKLVLHHWLVPLSLCPVVRTKFPNRVIDRVPRVERRGANTLMCPSPLHPWDAINRVPTPLHRFTRPHTDAIKHLRLPGLKAQGFWLSFHASRLRVGQTGSCVGPLRLSSRRTLALIQICASEVDASSFVRSTFSLSRLPPASGRCRVAPTERAPCLLASWDNYSTNVQHRQVFLPAGSRLFIPRLKDGGFQAWISVIPPLERVYSQRLCFHGVRLRLQDATMLPEEKVWVDTLMGEILQAGSD